MNLKWKGRQQLDPCEADMLLGINSAMRASCQRTQFCSEPSVR